MKQRKETPNSSDLPIYLFKQGNNQEAYRYFGAHLCEQNGEAGVVFRVWAPHAKAVSIVGDFNSWTPGEHPMEKVTDGIWERFVPGIKQFDVYKYCITTPADELVYKADPYAFHTETRPSNGSKVYDIEGYTKKELLNLRKEQEKLAKELSGVMNMGGQPDLLFVVDMPKEDLAIKEAKKLGIPVIAIADTNADPTLVDFPVPGNDDAIRAIQFYCELVSSAVLDGIQAEIAAQGVKVEEIMAENDAKPARKKAAKAAAEGEEEAKAGKKAKAAE